MADDRRLAPDRLAPDLVAALHAELADDLRRLALGVLRDPHLAADVVQTTFAKAVEQGHTADESLRGWLFRVAMNEALAIKRRQGTHIRVLNNLAWLQKGSEQCDSYDSYDRYDRPGDAACRQEDEDRVRRALQQLPDEQQGVVRMRLYEQKTFAVIAAELKVPLGTVLWRMQAAIKRLRSYLQTKDEQ